MGGFMAVSMNGGLQTIPSPPEKRYKQIGSVIAPRTFKPKYNQTVKVKYRVAGAASSVVDTVTLSSIELDLTKGINETVDPGSVRFTYGGSVFQGAAGALYRDASPATGAGILAGTIDPQTGKVILTSWSAGSNSVDVQSLVTLSGVQPVDEISFRSPASPLKPGVFQVRYQLADGTTKTKTIPQSGVLEDSDLVALLDWDRGIFMGRFGRWLVDADLTPEQKLEDWYDPLLIQNNGGVNEIWQPEHVLAWTVLYNGVATTMLPPDSALLGLDAARLPPTGEALIYQTGMLALVHRTVEVPKATLTAGEEIDTGQVRLYRVVIEDAAGARLPADLYTVNRELGLVTMIDPLDVSAYTSPFKVIYTIADLSRVRDTDINGNLTFLRPMTHDYPDGYVSGMLYLGTLQARISDIFEQTTWTGVWQDTRIGDQPLASYNAAQFPIAVTNAGAYKDRMLVKFTSSTAFQVIGENLGLVAIGDINNDCSPIKPLTGEAYFTIDYRGWGGGWATGNCLRFNLHAASYPVDLVRAVQPSDPTGQSDCVELLLVGSVDA
jgi:hypothetical protein